MQVENLGLNRILKRHIPIPLKKMIA